MTDALLIFAKNPELGKTKTRIGNKVGDEVALAVYYALIKRCQEVTQVLPQNKTVYYSSFIDHEDNWDDSIYDKRIQQGNDLGERMSRAIDEAKSDGAAKVVLIGTDIYDLNTQIIEQAFAKLNDSDVVIGPAADGGYYLIGMKECHSTIFELSEWSTSTVYTETLNKIKVLGLSASTTEMLNDIDEPEDLAGTELEKLLNKKTSR